MLLLLRHLKTQYNIDKVFIGAQLNPALAEVPSSDLIHLWQVNARQYEISRVFCSPMLRCMQTLDHFLSVTFLNPSITFAEPLREMNYGSWEGKSEQELRQRYPQDFELLATDAIQWQAPDGESFTHLVDRVGQFLTALPADEVILCCTHNDVISAAVAYFSQTPFSQIKREVKIPNGSLTLIDQHKATYSIIAG